MHFVLSPFGSSGDVNPFLALGRAWRRRGHRVTMLANAYFMDPVREADLEYIELGTRDELLTLTENPNIWHPRKALALILQAGVAPAMRSHYQRLAELQASGPIVAVSNLFGFGALVAREKLRIPLALVHLQPCVFWSDIEPPRVPGIVGPRWLKRRMYAFGERYLIDPKICPELNRWRAELDLPPVRGVTRWWHHGDLVCALFPTWFSMPQADWPQPLIQTSFPLWDEQNDEPLPPEIESFLADGEPPIVFTPGSTNVFATEFFQAAIGACARLQRRGLLLTRFANQVPQNLPGDVRFFAYAPFAQLLPRCAALVHHGGVGSMAQAMAAGIPQLLAVLAHDQFDNAERVRQLGIGDSTRFRSINARVLSRKLRPLLESTAVGETCRRVAKELVKREGVPLMAERIESHFENF